VREDQVESPVDEWSLDDGEEAVRCAVWTRAAGVDPIGSAGFYRSFLLLEWPLPWPRDLAEVPALGGLAARLSEAGGRLQAVVPRSDSSARVVLYHSDGAGFSDFERREVLVSPDDAVKAALDLLDQAASAKAPVASPAGEKEVLICGHGRRDRCCGRTGARLAVELLADPGRLGDAVRVGRTSHTGGHRFAPTAMVFPDGSLWAFADAELLRRVVAREGPVSEVAGHYRGCAGLGPARVQVLERAVLTQVGWELLNCRRWGWEEPDGKVGLRVELDGVTRTWEAIVEAERVTPVPVCGEPLTQATKSNAEYGLHSLRLHQ
jgi:hypothetical protein